jgi:hypothetical protein
MPVRDNNLAAEMALQKQCPLFEKLPAEILNEIYEYAFTTDDSSPRKDLANLERPCISLLLTCQRAFAESLPIYEAARTAFWTQNTFCINRRRQDFAEGYFPHHLVTRLHDREIDLMQKVVVVFDIGGAQVATDRQEWHLTARSDGMRGWVIARPMQLNTEPFTAVGKRSGLIDVLARIS